MTAKSKVTTFIFMTLSVWSFGIALDELHPPHFVALLISLGILAFALGILELAKALDRANEKRMADLQHQLIAIAGPHK